MSELEEIVVEQVCAECGKVRDGEPEYNAIQAITGQPLGWYSGDDGEFCPDDIAKLMNLGNSTRRYVGWKP
jgi:hypothetical protein